MIRRRSNISSYVTKDGSRVWELFHPGSSTIKGFSVAEALVEPGQGTEAHVHHASQEVYYILEGSGVMRLGEETLIVEEGDTVLIEAGVPHKIKNAGDSALKLLCVCCPPYSHDDTALGPR